MGMDVQKSWLRHCRRMALGLGLFVLALRLAGCGGGPVSAPEAAKPAAPSQLFLTWPKDRQPDVVLLLTGEQFSYLLPCGCSRPQYGGLDRRYNFRQALQKERGWPIVAVDIGDVAQRSGPQTKLKYKYMMEGMQKLDYTAVAIGENEMRMPLLDALGEFALNKCSPCLLAANLLDRQEKFPRDAKTSMIGSWIAAGGNNNVPKVGIAGVVGPTVAAKIQDPDVKFTGNGQVLSGVLKEMAAEKTELDVLLYQGTLEEAKACAKQFPQFHVVQCLTREEEPSATPEKVGDALVIGVGHKGRYIGLVGAFRTGNQQQPFDLLYQLVAMGPEYETAPGKEADSPILTMLEKYTEDVHRGNYLALHAAQKTPHPIQMDPDFKDATYVGSERCKNCHEHAYKIWKGSAHSHAYQSLVTATRPALRQFDGECVKCHVTGFDHTSGFSDEKQTPKLLNNGCENCHGPCSIHVKGDELSLNKKLLALMNPYKTQPKETPQQKQQRELAMDISCQKCHDTDNDVHWKFDKWDLIKHMEPRPAGAP